jgi:hypothetical protein
METMMMATIISVTIETAALAMTVHSGVGASNYIEK